MTCGSSALVVHKAFGWVNHNCTNSTSIKIVALSKPPQTMNHDNKYLLLIIKLFQTKLCFLKLNMSICQDITLSSQISGDPTRQCHDAIRCILLFCFVLFLLFCSLLLSFLQLSPGQIGSITGALTFTLAVINQPRLHASSKTTQNHLDLIEQLLKISFESMSPLQPTQLKKQLCNCIIHNCSTYWLHLLLAVGVIFAYPLQQRYLPCSLLFLHFQRAMHLIYCFIWQHFVNFLAVINSKREDFPGIPNCNFTVFT